MGKHRRSKRQKRHQYKSILSGLGSETISEEFHDISLCILIHKSDMLCKSVNQWESLRRIPFKAEHSNNRCFSSRSHRCCAYILCAWVSQTPLTQCAF